MPSLESIFYPVNGMGIPLFVWIVKGGFLMAALLLLQHFMKQQPAALRHGSLFAGIVMLMLIPLISAILPSWHLPLFASETPTEVLPVLSESSSNEAVAVPPAGEADIRVPLASPASSSEAGVGNEWSWLAGLWMLVWIAGCTVFALRFMRGCAYSRNLRMSSTLCESVIVQRLFSKVYAELPLRRSVKVAESSRVSVPITIGLWSPLIILPLSSREWQEDRLRVVLLHELAHIWRWDWGKQMLIHFIGIFHWINPFYWLAARRSRLEREIAADEVVLSSGEKPSFYASQLLAIGNGIRQAQMPREFLLPMARASQLEDRLLAILDGSGNESAKKRWMLPGLLAAGITCLLLISACSVQPKQSDRSITQDMLAELRSEQGPEAITIVVLGESLGRQLQYDYANKDDRFLGEALQDPDWEKRTAAAYALGASERPPTNLIIRALADQRWEVRHFAAWAAGRSGDRSLIESLAVAMEDQKWEVSHLAVLAVAKIDARAAIEPLSLALKHPAWQTAHQAAWALGRIQEPAVTEPLIAALSSKDWMTRHAAAWALGEIRASTAVTALVQSMQDEAWQVRKEAAKSLGRIADPIALQPLQSALDDDHEKVRGAAFVALEQYPKPGQSGGRQR